MALMLTACAPNTAAPPAALPSPTSVPEQGAPEPSPTPASVIATHLQAPWDLVFAGETPLYSQRDTGEIGELLPDGTSRVVGTIAGVVHGGEGGLLGLAVREDQLFVYSTGTDGNRVQRYQLGGSPGAFTLGAPTTIIAGIPAARTHNGGRIAWGPDGMLYVATGDAGDASASQDPGSLGGKILRLTADGAIPPDNPTPGSPVYSLGHRNVQGLAWTATGTMYASEFGQNTWDELNIITPGANYGWPTHEGVAGAAGFSDPIATWPTDAASPSGITIADDVVYIANLRGRVLRAVDTAAPYAETDLIADAYGRLRHVTLAPDGSLWVLTNNTDGRGDPSPGDDRIIRLDPDATPAR